MTVTLCQLEEQWAERTGGARLFDISSCDDGQITELSLQERAGRVGHLYCRDVVLAYIYTSMEHFEHLPAHSFDWFASHHLFCFISLINPV